MEERAEESTKIKECERDGLLVKELTSLPVAKSGVDAGENTGLGFLGGKKRADGERPALRGSAFRTKEALAF